MILNNVLREIHLLLLHRVVAQHHGFLQEKRHLVQSVHMVSCYGQNRIRLGGVVVARRAGDR